MNTMKSILSYLFHMQSALLLCLIFSFSNISICIGLDSQKLFVPGSINVRIKQGITIDQVQKELMSLHLSNRINPTFTPLLPLGLRIADNGGQSNRTILLPAYEKLTRTYTMIFDSLISTGHVLTTLRKQSALIEVAEPRYSESVLFKPNDLNINTQVFLPIIKAFEAWDVYTGDSSMTIGIIDNGFLQTHEDLKDNIGVNSKEIENNSIDDDNNGFVDDARGVNLAWQIDGTPAGSTYNSTDGHGTSVAGVASATWNNEKGIAGVGAKTRFFPIKAGKQGTDRVEFGYEGILYGIMRGFPVLNCSWGSANTYSEINQSIIDFAVERNILIVAGAGNDNNRAPIYPASYRGVMSVGETDVIDMKSNGSSYGWSTDIMAPGYNVRTTDNENFSYTSMSGTSFAAPIVSGAAALVHGKYPEANMVLIAEHLKATADPIDIQNSFLAGFLPGRLNLMKALQDSPFSRGYISTEWVKVPNRRNAKGDTISIRLKLKNIGAVPSNNVTLKLSSLDNFFKPLLLLDTIRIIPRIETGAIDTSIALRMVILESSDAEFYHSLDISDESGPLPSVLIPIRPTPSITTFETENLLFSMGDFGSLGFVNDRTVGSAGNEQFDGMGFILKNVGSTLYDGGLVVGAMGKVMTGFATSSGFEPRTRFSSPNEGSMMILTDSLNPGSERIGLAITQQIAKLSPSSVTIKYTLVNMNEVPIYNPAFGLFGDWDIGNYGRENRVERFIDAIPNHMLGRCEAEIAWKDGRFAGIPHPFVGVACFAPSTDQSFKPQTAGMNAASFSSTSEEFTALMNSGNSVQYGTLGDIAMFTGGRFERPLLPNDSAIAYIIISADTSRIGLSGNIRSDIEAIEGPVTVKGDNRPNDEIVVKETQDLVQFSVNVENNWRNMTFSISNLQGLAIYRGLIHGDMVTIYKKDFSNGFYFFQINDGLGKYKPFLIHD